MEFLNYSPLKLPAETEIKTYRDLSYLVHEIVTNYFAAETKPEYQFSSPKLASS